MDSGQKQRIDTLFERVLTLCADEQPNIEEISGAAEQPEQKLKIIRDLLGAKEADAPLSLLEEKYVSHAAKWKAYQALDKAVDTRLAKHQREYYNAIRKEIIEQLGGAENTSTLKKMAELSIKEGIRLSAPALALARPRCAKEIVGQEGPMRVLTGCLCTPYPQHVIIYGPPGVGKTTAARIALDEAKRAPASPFLKGAPFVEVDGTTMRYDRQGGVNPLIGSVHDPIYQGAAREMAQGGIPEPKPGLVTQAHGGVLFIDEIGEMDAALQNMLLKVLEDKRVFFDSPYYDPENPALPGFMRQLFEHGAPADFVLVAATTRRPEEIPPALRSRCTEIFFSPLDEGQLYEILKGAARRMQVQATTPALKMLAGMSGDGRSAVRLLLSAHALAGRVDLRAAREAVGIQEQASIARDGEKKLGRIAVLGVLGGRGIVLPLEAITLPGSGRVQINQAAGSMVQDAVRNAHVALRKMGLDLSKTDMFLSIGGGGQVDGPSIGLAAALVMLSAALGLPICQDVAASGEIGLHAEVLPVGGLTQKKAAARRHGYRRMILPRDGCGEAVVGVSTLLQAAAVALDMGEDALRERLQAAKAN